jgi:D-beta-D-heptose 7-phosphate kinase/D-beta-D-heptose 1-phosphate adenosyltransferase|tara:strand:- start:8225 stop:8995 length:771 start_codon:yes stop_codon:yes gene_type:complete
MYKTVLVTGGFDPIHSGHISYLREASKLGKRLIVGLNSDDWLARKKGRAFLPYEERKQIVEGLEMVDSSLLFNDDDDSACDAIDKILRDTTDTVVFANGGDRNGENTPEYIKYKNHPDVEFAFNVGGEKTNSSSWILNRWRNDRFAERDWGQWKVYDEGKGWKVKQLVIYPGQALSNQKHNDRSEHWWVLEGNVQIDLRWDDGRSPDWQIQMLSRNTDFIIPSGVWHKTSNIGTDLAVIVETQFGDRCEESDIIRK